MWALVNTQTEKLLLQVWFEKQSEINPDVQVKMTRTEEIEAIPGTICNLIVYDGSSPFEIPENYKLVEVAEDAKIGDTGY